MAISGNGNAILVIESPLFGIGQTDEDLVISFLETVLIPQDNCSFLLLTTQSNKSGSLCSGFRLFCCIVCCQGTASSAEVIDFARRLPSIPETAWRLRIRHGGCEIRGMDSSVHWYFIPFKHPNEDRYLIYLQLHFILFWPSQN